MQLCKRMIERIDANKVDVPAVDCFSLPEKVLQFGTGVLLRGLPDYFIDKANKKGIFNGRIVVVKSTAAGGADAFEQQDGLYTHCVRGVVDGQQVEEYIVNASVSRVLNARTEWDKVLACAGNPELEIVISNTTEVGILLQADEDIRSTPPESYPGKLLAFLYERYKAFAGAKDKGLVIIPTELIPDNGSKLEAVVEELAHLNNLEFPFIDWLESCNHFCNSLVDRIVPGKLDASKQQDVSHFLGYTDELMIMSEVYRLWAIEGDEKVRQKLGFAQADEGVVIAPNIEKFRELKLRLLNGSHTVSCGLAFLAGYHTVKQAMADPSFANFVSELMNDEIIPAITGADISVSDARTFAASVIDRFRNPYIDHQWLGITIQYSSKLVMRVLPILRRYVEVKGAVPSHIAKGFAAYILFMRSQKDATGKYWGNSAGRNYIITDDKASIGFDKWNQVPADQLVKQFLSEKELWGMDLTTLPGFEKAVAMYVDVMENEGAGALFSNHSVEPVVA